MLSKDLNITIFEGSSNMRVITKILIVSLLVVLLFAVSGCCDDCSCDSCCDDCCEEDEDDASKDKNEDGTLPQEQETNRLDETQQQQEENVRTPGECEGINENRAELSASKSPKESGNTYTYSFTILSCASTVGYIAVFEGTIPKTVEQGQSPKGQKTERSNTYDSDKNYTQFCLRTGDKSIQQKCVPVSG